MHVVPCEKQTQKSDTQTPQTCKVVVCASFVRMALINACVNAGASLLRHSPSISHLLSLPRFFSAGSRNPVFADVARPILNVANNSTDTAAKALRNDKAYGRSPEDCASIVGVTFDSTTDSWTARWTTADGQKKSFSRCVSKHGFLQAKRMAEQARTEAVAAGARTRGPATRRIRKVLGDTAFSAGIKASAAQHRTADIKAGAAQHRTADIKAGAAQHRTADVGSRASHYEVLGITQEASKEEIKAAFKKAAKRFHPDVSKEPGAEQKILLIRQAYDVLSDAAARAAYDVNM